MDVSGDELKHSMRSWTSGVAIVTSVFQSEKHGMTVNSFVSVSIDPPIVCVTLANDTRTKKMVDLANIYGLSILSKDQIDLADRFSGRISDNENRFLNIVTFTMISEVPFIHGGLAFFDCVVEYKYEMKFSTSYFGLVKCTRSFKGSPLIYHNREYRNIKD